MRITGNVLSLPFADIDTDQIIPAQHLSVMEPGALGRFLFDGHRELCERLDAVAEPRVVVALENFGSGSSREHAVWALQERGIQAVIPPSFSRIFLENAYNNGLAPIVLTPSEVQGCMNEATLSIDVDTEAVILPNGDRFEFRLDPLRKTFLVGGGYLKFLAANITKIREWERCRA